MSKPYKDYIKYLNEVTCAPSVHLHEAARLQGFPDWFEFVGTEESQFTQIGNAVSPVFAYKLAKAVIDCLEGVHSGLCEFANN